MIWQQLFGGGGLCSAAHGSFCTFYACICGQILWHEFELLLATPIVKLTHEVELLLNHQTIIRAALAAGAANQGVILFILGLYF